MKYCRFIKRGEEGQSGGKNLKCWVHYSNYFPAEIHKEVDLNNGKKVGYVMGYHPHGIIGLGAFSHFISNGTNRTDVLSEINPHMMILNPLFYIPFSREIALLGGACSVSKSSCVYSLKQGQSIVIAIGGAKEALDARPGTLVLTLNDRFGFVKIALQNGADLVPILSFGENEMFNQVENEEGSVCRNIQNAMQKYMGFSMPLPYGRGIFNYDLGMMPHRVPIRTFVGVPISVEKDENPSSEKIKLYHQKYLASLTQVYEKYKDQHFRTRSNSLVFK